MPSDSVDIEIHRDMLDIPIREIPKDRLEEARKAFAGKSLAPAPTVYEDIVRRELLLLSEDRDKDPYAHAEMMAVRIGNSAIVCIPAEFFCELGMRIKDGSSLKPTFVIELANGCVGYIPTAEAFTGGGYETDLVRSSKLIIQAGEMVIQKALELLQF
jgi:hypothetical protein